MEKNPLSTFSIDVDTASYANARRFLTSHQLPPPGAVAPRHRLDDLVREPSTEVAGGLVLRTRGDDAVAHRPFHSGFRLAHHAS